MLCDATRISASSPNGWWSRANKLSIAMRPVAPSGLEVDADITERRRVEQSLRESRAQFAGIIDSAMDAIISVDESQRVVLFNAAAERIFRCEASKAIGQPLDRFIPARLCPAHREHVRAFGATGATSRAMGKLKHLTALRADGMEFPIEASISQTEVGGGKLFTAIVRDSTGRGLWW